MKRSLVIAAAAVALTFGAAQAQQDRDPFVRPTTPTVAPAPAPQPAPVVVQPQSKPQPQAVVRNTEPAPVSVPEVTVTGIVRSGSRSSALLSADQRTYMVSVGDRLGAWKVTAIRADEVELTTGGHTALLQLSTR